MLALVFIRETRDVHLESLDAPEQPSAMEARRLG